KADLQPHLGDRRRKEASELDRRRLRQADGQARQPMLEQSSLPRAQPAAPPASKTSKIAVALRHPCGSCVGPVLPSSPPRFTCPQARRRGDEAQPTSLEEGQEQAASIIDRVWDADRWRAVGAGSL